VKNYEISVSVEFDILELVVKSQIVSDYNISSIDGQIEL